VGKWLLLDEQPSLRKVESARKGSGDRVFSLAIWYRFGFVYKRPSFFWGYSKKTKINENTYLSSSKWSNLFSSIPFSIVKTIYVSTCIIHSLRTLCHPLEKRLALSPHYPWKFKPLTPLPFGISNNLPWEGGWIFSGTTNIFLMSLLILNQQ